MTQTVEKVNLEPMAKALYDALKNEKDNPKYKDYCIGSDEWKGEKTRPCWGLTIFKTIKFEKCHGSGCDKIRFKSGKSEFLIAGRIKRIIRICDVGNYWDKFTIEFEDGYKPLEIIASWYKR